MGGARGTNVPPICFLPKNRFWLGSRGANTNLKYFTNDYLGFVKTEKRTESWRFTGRRVEASSI